MRNILDKIDYILYVIGIDTNDIKYRIDNLIFNLKDKMKMIWEFIKDKKIAAILLIASLSIVLYGYSIVHRQDLITHKELEEYDYEESVTYDYKESVTYDYEHQNKIDINEVDKAEKVIFSIAYELDEENRNLFLNLWASYKDSLINAKKSDYKTAEEIVNDFADFYSCVLNISKLLGE